MIVYSVEREMTDGIYRKSKEKSHDTNERKLRTDFYFYEIESFDEDSVISTD
jgi:hypothetical protein